MKKNRSAIERGGELTHSQAIRQRMAEEMLALIRAMQKDVLQAMRAIYEPITEDVYARQLAELQPRVVVADATIADMVAKKIDQLAEKWGALFDDKALGISDKMVGANLARSDSHLNASLKDLGKRVSLKMTEELKEKMSASAQEASALIKRVPAEYLPNVQQDVMRSLTTGGGLKELVEKLEERNVKVRNWAVNVARDQTRKAYATINTERVVAAGLKKFEWIHSGGANQPRKHHITRFPAGLNGGIFSFAEPPIIDERTGERGMPGQLPFCGCTFRVILELEENE